MSVALAEQVKQHESKITAIVTDTISETFQTYFNIDCSALAKNMKDKKGENGIICRASFKNGSLAGAVFVTFDPHVLEKVSQVVYPPDQANSPESYESCAKEIANIVGMRVKSYLNENGYTLHMDIPSIDYEIENDEDDIHISFKVEHDNLYVDIHFNIIEKN